MKSKVLTLFAFLWATTFTLSAQDIKEKDVLGTWKLVIDVQEEIDEEAEEADTILEEIILKSVSGVVSGVLNNIDIYFEFQKRNDLLITVEAFGEVEEEEARWYINRRGNLVIEDYDDDEDDNFHIDADDEWKLIDGLLVSDDHEDDRNVFMTRVD